MRRDEIDPQDEHILSLLESYHPLQGIDTDSLDSVQILSTLDGRLNAAYRALSLANKLKNPEQQKKHKSRVFSDLNKIKSEIGKVLNLLAAE